MSGPMKVSKIHGRGARARQIWRTQQVETISAEAGTLRLSCIPCASKEDAEVPFSEDPSIQRLFATAMVETDLSNDPYINAHCDSDTSVGEKDDDDGLAMELENLVSFGAELASAIHKSTRSIVGSCSENRHCSNTLCALEPGNTRKILTPDRPIQPIPAIINVASLKSPTWSVAPIGNDFCKELCEPASPSVSIWSLEPDIPYNDKYLAALSKALERLEFPLHMIDHFEKDTSTCDLKMGALNRNAYHSPKKCPSTVPSLLSDTSSSGDDEEASQESMYPVSMSTSDEIHRDYVIRGHSQKNEIIWKTPSKLTFDDHQDDSSIADDETVLFFLGENEVESFRSSSGISTYLHSKEDESLIYSRTSRATTSSSSPSTPGDSILTLQSTLQQRDKDGESENASNFHRRVIIHVDYGVSVVEQKSQGVEIVAIASADSRGVSILVYDEIENSPSFVPSDISETTSSYNSSDEDENSLISQKQPACNLLPMNSNPSDDNTKSKRFWERIFAPFF